MRARWLAALLLLGACSYDPQFRDGETRCGSGGSCPPAFVCDPQRGRCFRLTSADAGPTGGDERPPSLSGDGPAAEAPGDGPPASPDAPLPAPDVRSGLDVGAPSGDAPLGADGPLADARAPADLAPACEAVPVCMGRVGTACVDEASLVRCETDARGCLVTRPETACNKLIKPCRGTAPTAACTCVLEPAACQGRTGKYCVRATQIATCTRDALGCLQSASVTDCPLGTDCREGQQPLSAECRTP
jgi:hypothetical protein